MRALAACVFVLFAATLAGGVESGQACSCALPDPRAALAQADGAFVGTLVSRQQLEQQAVLVFSVEKSLKGSIGRTVEVRTAANGAGCGLEAPVGTRVGLVLERRGGAWHGYLCWQFDPAELLAAALPLPPPNGRGAVALVVGGEFGDVRLIALDARGRTLAYGRGGGRAGLVSVCPRKRRIAEVAFADSGTTLVVRAVPTLRIVRRQTVALPGGRYPQRLWCDDASGATSVIFARGPTDSPAKAALYRVASGRMAAIWNGAAYDAAVASSSAYLSAGMSGRNLLEVDLESGRARRLGTLPGPTTSLGANEAGTLLAGVHLRLDRPSQVVRVDLTRKPATLATARLSRREVYGQVFWLPTGRLLFVPAYGGTAARIFDDALRMRSEFRWTAGTAALVGSSVFGTDQTLSLFRATLPSGPQRIVRQLPGRSTLLVAATH